MDKNPLKFLVSEPSAHKVAFDKVMNVPQSVNESVRGFITILTDLLVNITYLYCIVIFLLFSFALCVL